MSGSGRDDTDIVRPSFVRRDERGTFIEVLNSGRWQSVVVAEMRAGAELGHHYHKLTDVFVYLRTGRAHVVEVDVATGAVRRRPLGAGEGILLRVNVWHVLRFEEPSSLVLLKSRQYDSSDPDTYAYPVPL